MEVAFLDDLAVLNHSDTVALLNSGQAVSHDDRRAVLHNAIESALNLLLTLLVKRRSGLIKEQDLGLPNDSSRNSNSLLLATRELGSLVAAHSVEARAERLPALLLVSSGVNLVDLGPEPTFFLFLMRKLLHGPPLGLEFRFAVVLDEQVLVGFAFHGAEERLGIVFDRRLQLIRLNESEGVGNVSCFDEVSIRSLLVTIKNVLLD